MSENPTCANCEHKAHKDACSYVAGPGQRCRCVAKPTKFMDFWDWLEYGKRLGWCTEPVCATHDGIPGTDEEDAEWEEGYDPCQHVLRLWGD